MAPFSSGHFISSYLGVTVGPSSTQPEGIYAEDPHGLGAASHWGSSLQRRLVSALPPAIHWGSLLPLPRESLLPAPPTPPALLLGILAPGAYTGGGLGDEFLCCITNY